MWLTGSNGRLWRRDVKKQFVSSMAAKFQLLQEVFEDIEMKCSLFRTAMILLAVESCGRKAAGSNKRTPWLNQDVKESSRAKKDAFKVLLQNRHHLICNPDVPRCEKLQLGQKCPKNALGGKLVVG